MQEKLVAIDLPRGTFKKNFKKCKILKINNRSLKCAPQTCSK